MNYPNIIAEIKHAEQEGFHRGRQKAYAEAKAVYDRDRYDASAKSAARGFIAGFACCAFVAFFWMLFLGLGWFAR